MTRVVAEAVVTQQQLDAVLRPRHDIVTETRASDGVFILEDGPLKDYSRTVEVTDSTVKQTVDYRLAIPYFGFLFALPLRRRLGRLDLDGGRFADGARLPWWHPADRLDGRATTVLAALALLSIVTGYMGTLLTETVTYAAAEFHAGKAAQGIALASIRADVVLSLALVAAADRRGRRPVLFAAAAAGCVLTAIGGLSPSLAWLAASQILARGCVTAAAVVISIVAAEEMPAGSRAYAVSLLAMSAALGSGIAVMALPIAGVATWTWRLMFALTLAGIPVLVSVARHLPESHRFNEHKSAAARARTGEPRAPTSHRGRLALLAVSALLLSLFLTPAAQFQNEFLRTERHYSASRISLFTLATNTPGGVGVVVGGRLADVRGRRIIGALGLVFGVGATVAMFFSRGWGLWTWSVIGAVTGAAVVPALGVYGPELFPTGLRGKANGAITAAGRLGSVVGLVTAGVLSSTRAFGHLAPALGLLAIGPFFLAILVLTIYPETARLQLEELNPEDAAT